MNENVRMIFEWLTKNNGETLQDDEGICQCCGADIHNIFAGLPKTHTENCVVTLAKTELDTDKTDA